MGRPSAKPPQKQKHTFLGPLRLPGVIPITDHPECSRCAYDLCGLASEAYAEVYHGGRFAIRRMVRCPECGLLQRYLASAPRGRPKPHPLDLWLRTPGRREIFPAVVAVAVAVAILIAFVLGALLSELR